MNLGSEIESLKIGKQYYYFRLKNKNPGKIIKLDATSALIFTLRTIKKKSKIYTNGLFPV